MVWVLWASFYIFEKYLILGLVGFENKAVDTKNLSGIQEDKIKNEEFGFP
jgi:hypothetical protein